MGWDTLRDVAYGVAPALGVSLVFYVVIRAIIRADASERAAERQFGPPAEGARTPNEGPAGQPRDIDAP